MSRVVGIDLGTTNSLVAYVKDGVPLVIREQDGLPMTRHQRAVRDGTLHRIRAVLTDAELDAAMTAGAAMDLDALVTQAFEVDPAAFA